MKKSVLDYLKELDRKVEGLSADEVVALVKGYDFSDERIQYYAFLENFVLPQCAVYSRESFGETAAASVEEGISIDDDNSTLAA